ncbi:MAG: protein kinase [Phycisphaerales bacterium JB047]
MTPPDEQANNTPPDPAKVKSLFGQILDAQEDGDNQQAQQLLEQAQPGLRQAVESLLHAHERASGALLDDKQPPSNTTSRQQTNQPVPTIEGYEIGNELGRGGFGIVYRAQQRTPIDRPVAIKVLRRELVSDEAISRFKSESTLLARMNHESIARVYDAGLTNQGQPFVAMQLIDAQPLNRACETLRINTRQRIELMARICDAIQHAHNRAVIHRDLKPANILIEQHENELLPRVIDFGIAKLLEDDPNSPHTHTQARLGTPRYMSPEQRAGTLTSDTRSDVYALGAILCELLAGDVPTAANSGGTSHDSRITRPSKIASDRAELTATQPKVLRGDLDRIVLKACAEEPDQRYPTAQAMGDDLRRYLNGHPIIASPPSVLYVTRKFVRRHRASVSLAAVLGIALVASMGIAALKWREANRQRDQAHDSAERVAFIGDFLLEMLLLAADNNVRGAPTLLTEEAMQEIADRAKEGLRDDPDRMLPMLEGIARFQAQSGYSNAGADTMRSALDFAIQHHGSPSPEVVSLRTRLYDLLWGHGLEGAKEQIALADEESAQLFDDNDPRRLRVLQRSQSSIEDLERIIAIYESTPGIDPSDLYQALLSLCMRQRFSQTPSDQLDTARRLYEVAKATYPPKHSAMIDSMMIYGEAMTLYAPSEEAAELLKAAYDASISVFGFDHFVTEVNRRGLARIYRKLGRPEEGIPYALDDVESVERSSGSDSIQYANALQELGRLYEAADQYDQAIGLFEDSLALKIKHWPAGHGQITASQVLLARACHHLGDDERAEQLCVEALEHLQERRHTENYAAAFRIRISIRARANDQEGIQGLRIEARQHLAGLGIPTEEVLELIPE